jgi:hypothetical protein
MCQPVLVLSDLRIPINLPSLSSVRCLMPADFLGPLPAASKPLGADGLAVLRQSRLRLNRRNGHRIDDVGDGAPPAQIIYRFI